MEKQKQADKKEELLSTYSAKLAEAAKNALPYIGNIRAMKSLHKALSDYFVAAQKLAKC